mmetsp:Transcript_39680/g.97527  ORF Transcript_39680/g.97527 Transcript_39680/m.97527 type:complete len:119 (-) Transcript_39680:3348-3704(-)
MDRDNGDYIIKQFAKESRYVCAQKGCIGRSTNKGKYPRFLHAGAGKSTIFVMSASYAVPETHLLHLHFQTFLSAFFVRFGAAVHSASPVPLPLAAFSLFSDCSARQSAAHSRPISSGC